MDCVWDRGSLVALPEELRDRYVTNLLFLLKTNKLSKKIKYFKIIFKLRSRIIKNTCRFKQKFLKPACRKT